MKRLICLSPNPADGTSWYRAVRPLSLLEKSLEGSWRFERLHFNKERQTNLGWSDISGADVLFLQRPCLPWNVDLILEAKIMGIKVWLDYDDDLFSVPYSNPAYRTYGDPETKHNIQKCAAEADVISVSTQGLKKVFDQFSRNVKVIPNASDFSIQGRAKIVATEKKVEKIIFWRGTKSHDEDLLQYASAIQRVAETHEDWRFVFLGEPWFGLSHFIPQKQMMVLPAITLPKYFGFLENLKPEISIVPLKNSVFNHSKSCIAWQEATFAGAACVVPDWEEWAQPGAMTYEDSESFFERVHFLITQPIKRAELAEQSLSTIRDRFDLAQVNDLRRSLLEELIN